MNETIEKNAINPNNENERPNNKTNTFNLVIGIATFLIALLGATFAYFSATARSDENAVTVKSAYVSISYDGGTEIEASNLIPATLNVAMKKYQKEKYEWRDPISGDLTITPFDPNGDKQIITEYDDYENDVNRKCVDANGRQVCYVYQFSIKSDGAEGEYTDIIASLKINTNEFKSLSYVLYEVKFKEDENGKMIDEYGFGIVDKYEVASNFNEPDTNPDNIDFINVKFAKFEKPYDVFGENGELERTVNPVACLFGYAEIQEGEEAPEPDDTARCSVYKLANQEQHTYQLVIWLEETGEEQEEQGKVFQGTVSIEVSGGFDSGEYTDGQITGRE